MTEEQMAQPITNEFLYKNFNYFNGEVWSTTPAQSYYDVDVYYSGDGKYTISTEPDDNVFTASTIGQLVTFLNLCGLQSFVSTLKI